MSSERVRTNEQRFWNLVNGPWCDERLDPYEDCWIWMGGRINSRRPRNMPEHKPWKIYGRFHWPLPDVPKHLVNAHRAALMLTIGPPPSDQHVAGHRCDRSLCVHPGHLVWETQAENIAEAFARNRLTRVGGNFATTGATQ